MTRPDKKEGVASVKVRDALALGYSCRQLISQQGIAEPEPERPRPEQATTLTQERERERTGVAFDSEDVLLAFRLRLVPC